MFSFSPFIDLSVAFIALAAFLANFKSFAYSKDVDTSVDLAAILPRANFRISALFVTLVAICWLANIGLWVVLILIFFIGLIPTIMIADQGDGAVILFTVAAFFREWAFGFPTFVLRPKPVSQTSNHEIIGKIGIVSSPLKPSGQITIGDNQMQAVSDGGEYIDTGLQISVTGIRNGLPTVRKVETTVSDDG